MYFWGDDNYHLINQIPISKYGFKNVPFDMTFSNDGNYCITNIMTNDNKNMFVFIDFQTGFVVDSSLFNLNYYDCLIRTTPDNRGLLCGGKDGTIRIFLPKILSKSVVAIFKSDTNKVLVNEPLKFQNYSHGLIRDYFWSFGDGKESTEKNPMHKYAKPGNYLVAMVASDGNNHDLFTQKDTIYVRNEIIPDFSASIDSGFVPLEVKFQDESKGGILKWNWDFGDGTKSTERNPTHIYEKEGNFKVTLALSDTIFNYSKVYEKQIKVKRSPILKPEIGFEVDLGVDSLKWENSSGIECLDGGYAICSQTARLIDSAWYGPDQDDFEYYYEYFTIVMRLNEFADTIWTKELTPFNKIQQTSDSCFILGKSNGKDIVVIKLDKNGNELWQKSYGTGFNDEFGNLQSTPDGGFIITGKANVLDNLQPEAKSLVIKIDKENKENFKLRYIGIGGRMKPTTDRNYIMCNLSQNSKSIFVSKIDFLGNNKWHREFTNSPKTFQCHDIIEYQNGFIVVGFKERGFVLYLDSLGNKVWEYDSPDSNSKFYCVAPYGENIAVSGSLQDTIGLRIFDKDGNLLERYNFKGRKGSVNSMVPTKDYGLFLVGTIKPPYTNTKVFALKINAETNNVKYLNDTQSSQLYPNPNSGSGIIKFTNEEAGLIEIKLFSITGTELKTITDSWFLEGEHEILCNFEDLSNGIYYYIIKQNGQLLNSNKLIIMR
jgi:PKD repeat protein